MVFQIALFLHWYFTGNFSDCNVVAKSAPILEYLSVSLFVYTITGTVHSVNCGSNTSSGGYKSIVRNPVEFGVLDDFGVDGDIYFFRFGMITLQFRKTSLVILIVFLQDMQVVGEETYFQNPPLDNNCFPLTEKQCSFQEEI